MLKLHAPFRVLWAPGYLEFRFSKGQNINLTYQYSKLSKRKFLFKKVICLIYLEKDDYELQLKCFQQH